MTFAHEIKRWNREVGWSITVMTVGRIWEDKEFREMDRKPYSSHNGNHECVPRG